MAREHWEEWLSDDGDALRARFHSNYLDMLDYCAAEFGRVSNLYALAAYAVWLHMPTRLRVPATQIELAVLLGFTSDSVFRKWRHRYPALFADDRTRDAVRKMVLDRVADVMDASLECAVNGGLQGFQDRKLVLEIAGIHKPTMDTTVTGETTVHLRSAAELSDDDLASIATGGSR